MRASSIQGKQTKHLGRDSSAARAGPRAGVEKQTGLPRKPQGLGFRTRARSRLAVSNLSLGQMSAPCRRPGTELRSAKRFGKSPASDLVTESTHVVSSRVDSQRLPTASEQEAKGKSSRATRQALRGLELIEASPRRREESITTLF